MRHSKTDKPQHAAHAEPGDIEQADLELTRKLLELETLYDVGMAVSSVLDISALADEILTRLVSILDLRAGFLLLKDDKGRLRIAAVFGIDKQAIRQLRDAGPEDLFEAVMQVGASRVLNHLGDRLASIPYRHLMLVPLKGRDTVLGVLGVLDKAAQGADVQPFAREDERLASAFANQAGIAVSNARLYRELKETNRRLEAAMEELKAHQRRVIQQERLQALGQMASGIAHDFNNALSAILGYTELWNMFPHMLDNKDRVLRDLETINTVAKDATHIVRRLRGFYRPREEGNVEVPVDLNGIIQQVIDITQPKWKTQALKEDRPIAVETDVQPIPAIKGDEADLREMFINLIFNAVDAMPQGGAITLRTRPVAKADGAPATHVRLEVCDTGVGMTEEVKRQCLEPFFSTKGEKGTGMGLAMVFGIIQRHHGVLEIDSAPGKGTTFQIRFPVLDVQKTPASQGDMEPSGLPYSIHVLMVDDDPVLRELMTRFLKKDGHTFEAASSGRAGLQAFHKGQFDVVVTDKMMPEVGGDRLARAIKAIAPKKPVILVTGAEDAADERIAYVDYTLKKPITLKALREALAQIVPNARRP